MTASKALTAGQASAEIAAGAETVRIPSVKKRENVASPKAVNRGVWVRAGAVKLRVEISTSGLCRMAAGDIVAGLGVSAKEVARLIRTQGLSLTTLGKPVAYLSASDASAIYFYGHGIDSIYTATNVYWLALGKGTTMAYAKKIDAEKPGSGTGPVTTTTEAVTTTTESVTTTTEVVSTTTESVTTTTEAKSSADSADTSEQAQATTAMTSFVDVLHVEKDVIPATGMFEDPESDFWYWDYLIAGHASLGAKSFTLDAPDAISGIGLDVTLLGMTATAHHVEIRLNGVSLGQTKWAGVEAHTASFDIPADVLKAGANEVKVSALLDSGVSYSYAAVDGFDLTYDRATVAISDQLMLKASATGRLKVTGLSTAGAWIIDIGDGLAPELVEPSASGGDAGAAWVEFTATEGDQYLVALPSGTLAPQAMVATKAAALRGGTRGADYIVITGPALAESAGRLAAYRASQGLRTMVVTTSEIYDQFNDGLADPHAIREFIAFALEKWSVPPRYILLAGEGSYDYKNNKGFGDSVVPTLMVSDGSGISVSDIALADTAGKDGVPEVAIGRIPAATPGELDAALAKIKAYEADSGTWRRSVLLAADNPDGGGDFAAESDILAAALPATQQVTKAYIGRVTVAEARSTLQGAFANGSLLVAYTGHGAGGQWAVEELLTVGDVASLQQNARLPIVTALTCMAGHYGHPGYDGLSEALIKRAGAGAIAVWSPTSVELSSNSSRLGVLFAQKLFGGSRAPRLGDAIRQAMRSAATEPMPLATLYTYNLLGDPALQVRW